MSVLNKKLYWIEFTNSGPDLLTWPFEAIGFDVKDFVCGLYPVAGLDFINDAFLEIESWRPDVLVFWLARSLDYPDGVTKEPTEIIQLRTKIQSNLNLKKTKLIAIIDSDKLLPDWVAKFALHYDYYSLTPLRIVEHAKIAKRLAGEEPSDTEGVTRYLSANGEWKVFKQSVPLIGVWLGAEGKFNKLPRTRILDPESAGQYHWVKNGIKEDTSTGIAFLVKTPNEWRAGLSLADLNTLLETQQQKRDSIGQFLLGVDSSFLEIEQETIIQVIKQAYQSGGWKIFLIDHMWAENKWMAFFDNLFYEKDYLEQRTIDYSKLINL